MRRTRARVGVTPGFMDMEHGMRAGSSSSGENSLGYWASVSMSSSFAQAGRLVSSLLARIKERRSAYEADAGSVGLADDAAAVRVADADDAISVEPCGSVSN